MRLLLINYEYPPIGGGAATATCSLAGPMASLGHRVTVLTAGFGERVGWERENGVSVYRCRALRKRAAESTPPEMVSYVLSAAARMPSLLRGPGFDGALVFFSIPCGPLGLWGRILAGLPYVVSLRGADVPGNEPSLTGIHRRIRPLRRAVLRHSKAIVANSGGLKALSEQADPFAVRVIPNGVDTDFFRPGPSPAEGTTRFLFAGRFREQKNLFFLLDGMNALAATAREEFELHLVGDGPLKKDLMAYASSLPVGTRISWHPWCDRATLRNHFRTSHCLLNPSLYEGMPNVVLEGMACGLPVIASRVIGNDEVVRDGVTGFLFSLTDPRGLQQALSAVLHRRDLAREMGRAARQWTEEHFSWSHAARQYLELFGCSP